MGKIKDSTIPDDGPDVIHDALCPWMPDVYAQGSTGPVMEFPCACVFIDKVRKDERDAYEDVKLRAYRKGQQDMLAECIAAVGVLPPKYSEPYLHDMQSVIATLRAFQEKP